MDHQKFETLKPEEQARVFYESHFRERAELLLYSAEPRSLTQSLSPEELYLMTREMDREERGDILCYASVPQLVFLSDVDCWKKDRISARGFLGWIETLLAADEDLLVEWLAEADYEMAVAGLKKLVHVLKPEREYASDEVLRDRPYFTIDQYYHIFVKEENLETVRRVLECLYEKRRGRYAALLEGVMAELDAEVEEEAFCLRQTRLEERGFPDPESALKVYLPITREEFDRFPEKEAGTARPAGHLPDYPILWSTDRLFLDEALLLFRDGPSEIRERLHEELVWLSNKVIACEGIDFASEDRVKRGVERVRRLVSIGIESLSGGDLARAKEILTRKWLETVLRWGFTQIARVRENARAVVDRFWGGSHTALLEFLDAPYEGVFRGALQAIPQVYDPDAAGGVDELRDFKALAETAGALGMVGEARAAHEFLERTFPGFFSEKKSGKKFGSLYSVLGTLYAHHVAGGGSGNRPIAEEKFRVFLTKGFQRTGAACAIDREKADAFLVRALSAEEKSALGALWNRVFSNMEEELARLDPRAPADGRFLSTVRVSNPKRPS